MTVYNLQTTLPPLTKTKNILKQLDPITDNFTNSITTSINKLITHHINSNLSKTWDEVITGLDGRKLKPLIYNSIQQLWSNSWDLGSQHGRDDILGIYKKEKVKQFNSELELATFADPLSNLMKQIEKLTKGQQKIELQQEDLDTNINRLQEGINNPGKYARKNISRDRTFSPEEQQTIKDTLSGRVSELQQQKDLLNKQKEALKQQEEFARYQITRVNSGQPLTSNQQLKVLSNEEVQQLRRDKKQQGLLKRNERLEQKNLERQQQLLQPLDSNKSLASQVVRDIRDRRITESQRNREVSNRLDKPITLKDETEFAKYLDKRYDYIAKQLSEDVSEKTKQNIQALVGNTKNKINTYLSSTEQKRERNLIQALSPLYPDYASEARKVIKETKGQRLTNVQIKGREQEIETAPLNQQKQLKADLARDLQVELSADQARRLGVGDKRMRISSKQLEQISNRKSSLARIKRTALTELSAAYNYGRFAHYEANDIELVRWVVSVEHLRMQRQTKKPYSGQGVVCQMCVGMSNRDTGYGPGIYDTLLFRTNELVPPPIHPNCNCYLEPLPGRRRNGGIPITGLASAAILGGVAIASIGLLNRMFNRTRPRIQMQALNELLDPVPQTILERLSEPLQNLYNVVRLKHRERLNIQLQQPLPEPDVIRLPNQDDQLIAERVLDQLETPINTAPSQFSIGQTVKARNTRVLSEGQRALRNDISVINKAEKLVRESENKAAQFKARFQAAQGNTQLQTQLLNQYTKYINDLNKTINSLDVSQIKLVNAFNTATNALEETKQTMQRYKTADILAPGLVNADDLVNNTNSVRTLNDQTNRLYKNITDTQQQRNNFRDTLLNTKNDLLNDTSMSQLYLQNKTRELGYLDEKLKDAKGQITLQTNLDTAEEYVGQVRQRVENQVVTNPRDYKQSLRDLEQAQEQLNLIRNVVDEANLDTELLERAANTPDININGVATNDNQVLAQRVKSKLDTLSQLEVESNNLQLQLKQLKNNSPKAKDQIDINPRQLSKEALLNDITRQMGSLVYEQQGLRVTNPRYTEISNLIQQLNTEKQRIDNAYFKRRLGNKTIQFKFAKNKIIFTTK